MTGASNQAETNRLIEGARDLGGLPAFFSAVVGAPSLLSLLELVTDYRLSATFQWIVDGYRWLTAVMALAVEPLVSPLIAKINGGAGWHLVLYPHWRPLFILMMVLLMGFGRGLVREAMEKKVPGWTATKIRIIAVYGVFILVGALIAGLMPLEGRWWEQGVVATAPLVAFYIGKVVQRPDKRSAAFDLVDGVVMVAYGAVFTIAACLTFVPGFERSAGIATLAALLVTVGVWALIDGIRTSDRSSRRDGFSLLGGFITAALIVGADQLVR